MEQPVESSTRSRDCSYPSYSSPSPSPTENSASTSNPTSDTKPIEIIWSIPKPSAAYAVESFVQQIGPANKWTFVNIRKDQHKSQKIKYPLTFELENEENRKVTISKLYAAANLHLTVDVKTNDSDQYAHSVHIFVTNDRYNPELTPSKDLEVPSELPHNHQTPANPELFDWKLSKRQRQKQKQKINNQKQSEKINNQR